MQFGTAILSVFVKFESKIYSSRNVDATGTCGISNQILVDRYIS